MPQFIQKNINHRGPDCNCKQNTEKCTVKMGIMIYMITALPGHIRRIKKKKAAVNNCRHGKNDHDNLLPGT
jgi:hypothetical protein